MKQQQEEALPQLEKTVECWKTRRDHFISQFHFYSCCRGEATPTGYTSVTHCRAEGYVSCRSSDNWSYLQLDLKKWSDGWINFPLLPPPGADCSWTPRRPSSCWSTSTAWCRCLRPSLRSTSRRETRTASSTWSTPRRRPSAAAREGERGRPRVLWEKKGRTTRNSASSSAFSPPPPSLSLCRSRAPSSLWSASSSETQRISCVSFKKKIRSDFPPFFCWPPTGWVLLFWKGDTNRLVIKKFLNDVSMMRDWLTDRFFLRYATHVSNLKPDRRRSGCSLKESKLISASADV